MRKDIIKVVGLPATLKKKHDDSNLLEKDMTVMRELALDVSNKEAALNLSENSPWDNDSVGSPPPSSTPKAAEVVPLCKKASSYIVAKGKTLPASFLTTLLPPQGFLEELSQSIQEEEDVPNLLRQFDDEIRCHKCHDCGLSLIGKKNLEKHTQNYPPFCTDLVRKQAGV